MDENEKKETKTVEDDDVVLQACQFLMNQLSSRDFDKSECNVIILTFILQVQNITAVKYNFYKSFINTQRDFVKVV